MKRLIAVSGIAFALLGGSTLALAQATPPPMPSLTPQQSAAVQQRVDAYRQQTESRVARGEITADEADRLIQWREWQIARQVAGNRPPPRVAMDRDTPPDYRGAPPDYDAAPPDYRGAPPDYRDAPSDDYDTRPREYVVEPAPYYGPYYRYATPYAWAPRPYYWGPAVCAGGFGRHFGGRICF